MTRPTDTYVDGAAGGSIDCLVNFLHLRSDSSEGVGISAILVRFGGLFERLKGPGAFCFGSKISRKLYFCYFC